MNEKLKVLIGLISLITRLPFWIAAGIGGGVGRWLPIHGRHKVVKEIFFTPH